MKNSVEMGAKQTRSFAATLVIRFLAFLGDLGPSRLPHVACRLPMLLPSHLISGAVFVLSRLRCCRPMFGGHCPESSRAAQLRSPCPLRPCDGIRIASTGLLPLFFPGARPNYDHHLGAGFFWTLAHAQRSAHPRGADLPCSNLPLSSEHPQRKRTSLSRF